MAFQARKVLPPLRSHPLLSLEQIVAVAVPKAHTLCGIYFLIREDRIVYVGQSRNMPVRIRQHKADPGKKFERYAMHVCPARLLDRLERYYILRFQPEYNLDLRTRHIRDGETSPNLRLANELEAV